MPLQEEELEETFFQPPRKVADQTIGYILIGLIVAFFFSVYLMGMERVQAVSDQVVGEHPQATTTGPVSEIGSAPDPVNP